MSSESPPDEPQSKAAAPGGSSSSEGTSAGGAAPAKSLRPTAIEFKPGLRATAREFRPGAAPKPTTPEAGRPSLVGGGGGGGQETPAAEKPKLATPATTAAAPSKENAKPTEGAKPVLHAKKPETKSPASPSRKADKPPQQAATSPPKTASAVPPAVEMAVNGGSTTAAKKAASPPRPAKAAASAPPTTTQQASSAPASGAPTSEVAIQQPRPVKASSEPGAVSAGWTRTQEGSGPTVVVPVTSNGDSKPAKPPAAPVVVTPGPDGVLRYDVAVLQRIRQDMADANSLGKPEGADIPADIDSAALALDPRSIGTPSPGPGAPSPSPRDGPGGGSRPPTPKLGFGRSSSSHALDRDSSNRASDGDVWQRGAAQQEEGRFSRQSSRDDGFSAPPRPPSRDFGDRRDGDGRDRRRGRGGQGRRGYRDASPPPLVGEDGYEPKRIEEEKRWKPTSLLRGGAGEDEVERKIRRARGILNKLSLEKFDKLSEEFLHVGYDSVELLEKAINIIVDKAQEEVHFSSMYAELCLKLSRIPLEYLQEQVKGKKFRRILLTRCQHDFERSLPERMADIDQLTELSQSEKAEKAMLEKHRYLGHMRFVGELFLKELLKDEHVHDAINTLLGEEDNPDEEMLECLCKLLTTTGKKLEMLADVSDDKVARKELRAKFRVIERLSDNTEKLTPRTRFLLKDLLDLRKNDYVPRRALETAKTISQVHAEVAKEEMAKAEKQGKGGGGGGGKTSSRPSSRSVGEAGGSQDARVQGGGGSMRSSASSDKLASAPSSGAAPVDDGWETVVSKKSTSKGPGTLSRAGSSTGASSSASTTGQRRVLGSQGSFAALAEESDKKKKKKEKKEKDEKKKEKKEKKEKKKKRKEEEEEDDDDDDEDEEDDDENRSSPTPPADSASSEGGPKPSLSRDEADRKAKSILQEYLGLQDAAEAIACVDDELLKTGADMAQAIEVWLGMVWGKHDEDRRLLHDLLVSLHAKGLVTSAEMEKGLQPTIEFLNDMKLDAPKIEVWVGELVGALLHEGVVAPAIIQNPPAQLIEDGGAASFAVAVLTAIKASHGADRARELRDAAGLDLKALLPPYLETEEDKSQELAMLNDKLGL